MLFALYLVLAASPRSDDTNLIQDDLTLEACQQASGIFNSAYHDLHPDEHPPKYAWVCRPQPPGVDHHEDLFRDAQEGATGPSQLL